MDELITLAKEYKKWEREPWSDDDHAEWCEFRKRNPPMKEDCHCGAFRDWREKALETAEKMADKILEWNSWNS